MGESRLKNRQARLRLQGVVILKEYDSIGLVLQVVVIVNRGEIQAVNRRIKDSRLKEYHARSRMRNNNK